MVEKGRLNRDSYSKLVDLVTTGGGEVDLVEDLGERAETETPQGVIARADPIPFHDIESVTGEGAALIVLDRVVDPHNLGAIARSALAAGMTALVRTERRSAPLGATALKSAAGALEKLPVVSVSSTADAVRRLGVAGVWSVALAADGDRPIWDLPLLTEPVAIVVGSEGAGVSQLVRDRVDVVASIPIDPMVESLNVSVAAALACFEVNRVRSQQ